jgi:hypothetical protein
MKSFLLLLNVFVCFAVHAQQEIPLYEKEIPDSKPTADSESVEMNADSILIIGKVSRPTLTIRCGTRRGLFDCGKGPRG